MNESFQPLVEALREELQQYGEMLALLEHQQELINEHRAEELLQNVAVVNAQTSVILLARRQSGERQRDVTRELRLAGDASFAEVVAALPSSHAVLVNALVNENQQCWQRLRQRTSQNHRRLARSFDLMQRLTAKLLVDPAGMAIVVRQKSRSGNSSRQLRPVS